MPESIGPYRVLSVLGNGGMGTVCLCEERGPLHRRVAIKVVKLGMDSRRVLARFELERRALSMMNHPSIANVFDAGMTETGRPYFVMEYVDGVALTKYCDQHELTIAQRLDLLAKVCQAVQHAHQKGILHRDLKPSNVLAFESEGGHAVKLIDFGLARATAPDDRSSLTTEVGMLIGTPEYMAPEQAAGGDIDTRADIYSLGAILFELLTGALPLDSKLVRRRDCSGVADLIERHPPPKPSSCLRDSREGLARIAAARNSSPKQLLRSVRGELDWIVGKAMAKERNLRYSSAADLARDIERFLANEPVEAGPPSTRYRLGKLARRYRAQVTALALVLITAISGALIAWGYARDAEAGHREARRQLARYEGLAIFTDIDTARREARHLFPAWPNMATPLRSWIENHGRPLGERVAAARAMLAKLESRVSSATTPTARIDDVLIDILRRGSTDLAAFETDVLQRVEHRLRWAELIERLSLSHPGARYTWDEAQGAIRAADDIVASSRYADHPIRLQPQIGLVPIGMNPATKLWEFYHLRSAYDPTSGTDPNSIRIPQHRADGTIELDDDTGIVFVLVPGGSFAMGAQSADSSKPNYCPDSEVWNEPVHQVTLAPYFLARHELTQGQWSRLTFGDNPSRSKPGRLWRGNPAPTTLLHPVEQVSWAEADTVLANHGLQLPTEAQWEYACRAGTHTTWYTGSESASLDGYENIADLTYARNGGAAHVSFDDGWGNGSSPVGAFRPNPFGFFDMHGNVIEWCRDPSAPYDRPVAPATAERHARDRGPASRYSTRGGSCICSPAESHSAFRSAMHRDARNYYVGLRASRQLDASR
ncbi:MAG: SUMF1/EgtB/PvdO family nonheme iron enzyme [Planctomycetes bacterium]|nr:SUMF1/EgtB/PvdO family nonheme iron enzyme [Planctomycetota bacterium]